MILRPLVNGFSFVVLFFPLLSRADEPAMPQNGSVYDEITEIDFFEAPDAFDESFNDQMMTRSRIKPEEIIGILVDQVHLPDILKKDFYYQTNPINDRSLLDLPVFNSYIDLGCDKYLQWGAKFFYNQTREKYFTQSSPYIGNYLAFLENKFWGPEVDFLESLKEYSKDAAKDLGGDIVDLPTILELFHNIKLEERRVGCMFNMQNTSGALTVTATIPLYYLERNFFLSHAERDAIAKAPLFQVLGKNSGESDKHKVEDFMKQHLVNDQFGLGDSRLQFIWLVRESSKISWYLGGEFTLPTAIAFKNGLIGVKFLEKPPQPEFDFDVFEELREDENQVALDYAMIFGTEALNRITRITTNTHLGGECLGVGGLVRGIFHPNETFDFTQQLRIHVLAPYYSVRFFKELKSPSEFDRDYGIREDKNDPVLAAEGLDFLTHELIQTLYPQAQDVRVDQNCIVQYDALCHLMYENFVADIGYDFWYKPSEQLSLTGGLDLPKPLNIPDSLRCPALQNKIFIALTWNRERPKYTWNLGLFGDFTFAQSGIGRDWTVGFRWSITS